MQMMALSDCLAVAPQIQPSQVPDIAAAGYRVLVNNRPDGEEAGQPTSAAMAAAAAAAGLDYLHLPVTAMDFPGAGFATMAGLLDDPARPVFAFCRSGTRCANLWVASRPREDIDAAVAQARRFGFDVSSAQRYLQQRG